MRNQPASLNSLSDWWPYVCFLASYPGSSINSELTASHSFFHLHSVFYTTWGFIREVQFLPVTWNRASIAVISPSMLWELTEKLCGEPGASVRVQKNRWNSKDKFEPMRTNQNFQEQNRTCVILSVPPILTVQRIYRRRWQPAYRCLAEAVENLQRARGQTNEPVDQRGRAWARAPAAFHGDLQTIMTAAPALPSNLANLPLIQYIQ